MKKPLTFRFKPFGAGSPSKPLVLDLEARQRAQETLRMMSEGKMPVPNNYDGLSKQQLESIGITKVRLSKKYGSKYVGLVGRTPKQYDS